MLSSGAVELRHRSTPFWEMTVRLGDVPSAFSPRDHSEATAREVDLAIREIITNAFDKAKAVLTGRRVDLDAGTALLLEHETITPADFPPLRQAAPGTSAAAAGV